MAKTTGRKPTSPLKDALRLFFRNKPAVMAAVAIFALAVAAISGELLTGQQPTEQEIATITENRYIGDKIEIKRNDWAISNPLESKLEDKLLPPFTRSDATGEFYPLGTDHLGRDVLSRLWAGSTISLTIGFLAVGIMVLLGISLGGIAGFWGRERIRLPFFAMLLLALGGLIAYGAEFPALAWPMFALAACAFLFQFAVVIIGKRWRAVIGFMAVVGLFLAVNGYNMFIEHTDPNGKAMQQASLIQSMSRKVLLDTRDFGYAVAAMENQVDGARSAEWRQQQQHETEVAFARLALEDARYKVIDRTSAIAILERTIAEREKRAAHMDKIDRPARAESERANIERETKRLEELKNGLPALEAAVEAADAALSKVSDVEVSSVALQTSAELLDRRAIMRQDYLDKYKAEAANRFKSGLIDAKLLSSHWRYPVYRITRHFITATILWLGLLVAILFIAGKSQGVIQDVKGPLQKLFIPTMTVDDLVMRFTEIMLTIPTLFLILAVLAMFDRDVYIVMAVIGLTGWMGMTRFVRAEILSLREQDFIQAARSLGVSDYRIMWRHLVPNAISPVLVAATIGVAGAVLSESTLSFLGIGARADQPTWGQILNDGRAYMTDAWWLMVIPGFAILVTVLSFNLLGEGLREAFNPKLRGR